MCLGDAAYVDGGRLCRCPGPTRVAHEGQPLKRRKVKKKWKKYLASLVSSLVWLVHAMITKVLQLASTLLAALLFFKVFFLLVNNAKVPNLQWCITLN